MHLLFFLFGICIACMPDAALPSGRCATEWAKDLSQPRSILRASNGDLIVVESGRSRIVALWDANHDGRSDLNERKIIAEYSGLNHGLELFGDFLYASSPTTLVKWKYSVNERKAGPPIVVVKNIPSGGHRTRTPKIDSNGFLFLSIGSATNIDPNPDRSEVRRFDLSNFRDALDWKTGEVWASGLRNEVGLNFDRYGKLWGVMNGMDDVKRQDLGGDIHNTNPAEALNLLSERGKFYGYPYCWTEYLLPRFGKGKGTQWAHENFIRDGVHTDAWCQNKSKVTPPTWPLNPHNAPLDLLFWYSNAFGQEFNGDLFISMHGSWDRQPPSGYRVQRVKFQNGLPIADEPFFAYKGPGEKWPNNIRPVGLAKNLCLQNATADCLYVSSDASGNILQIR